MSRRDRRRRPMITKMPEPLEGLVRHLHEEHHPGYPFPEGEILVALEDWRLAGYAIYEIRGEHLFVVDFGVLPAARGRGISKALLRAQLDIGRERGCTVAIGATQPDNGPM